MKDLGYNCYELSESLSQFVSPFSRGIDGELVGLYVQKINTDHYRVSDGGDAISHMLSFGITLNKKRTDYLIKQAYREGVTLSEDTGEIHISAKESELGDAINRVISFSLEIGYLESSWVTSSKNPLFKDFVGDYLKSNIRKVESNVSVSGLSGHQLEIPYVIRGENNIIYIETVGRKNDKVNWSSVYKVTGAMSDLRMEDAKRCIVLDDLNDLDTKQAEVALSEHAIVLPFSARSNWIRDLAS